jgi:glycosyltransferase involved in cell wall biosynthesis
MSKPLRIAFQSPFPPFRGGIATFGKYVLRSLAKLDEVQITAYNYTRLYPDVLFPGKTQYEESPEKDEIVEGVVHAYNPPNWRQAARQISIGLPDVYLYSHWHPFFCVAQLRILSHLKRSNPSIKIAGILHNVIPHETFPFQKNLTRSLFQKTDIPIVLSGQTSEEFRSLKSGRELVKLFHPVYTQDFPELSSTEIRTQFGVRSDETMLLFFGLIRPYKGLDVLIKALNTLDMNALKLRLFVVGEFYMDKRPILEQINVQNKSFIHIRDEFVSDKEAAEYMLASDVMVLPYKTASQSGIISNALNFHLPVICSNHIGLAEQVLDGKNGLHIQPDSTDSLREAIVQVLDKKRRSDLRNGAAELKTVYSWERFAQTLYASLTN